MPVYALLLLLLLDAEAAEGLLSSTVAAMPMPMLMPVGVLPQAVFDGTAAADDDDDDSADADADDGDGIGTAISSDHIEARAACAA